MIKVIELSWILGTKLARQDRSLGLIKGVGAIGSLGF
jgi:hypothetical protein